MYVTKRGQKFRAWERFVLPDGTVKKVSVTMDRDTPQSRRKAAAMLAEKISAPSDSNSMTYLELVEAYIRYQKTKMKMSTWTRNEKSLVRLQEVFGNAKITEMNAGFIEDRLLQKAPDPTTFNEYLKRVKAMFRWAYRREYIRSSACVDKIQPLKEERTASQKVADKYLEADELKKILESTTDYYHNIFEFLALSGLRIGELIALENDDITETDIIVRKTYDSINGVVTSPKTPAGWRYVHIQPELRGCTDRIRSRSREYCLRCGVRVPFFVVSPQGGRLSYAKTNRVFKQLCERLAGKPLTLHALRHTHVALMAESGVDLDAIARRCGHSDSDITREIYYHVTKKQREKDNAAFDSVSILA